MYFCKTNLLQYGKMKSCKIKFTFGKNCKNTSQNPNLISKCFACVILLRLRVCASIFCLISLNFRMFLVICLNMNNITGDTKRQYLCCSQYTHICQCKGYLKYLGLLKKKIFLEYTQYTQNIVSTSNADRPTFDLQLKVIS